MFIFSLESLCARCQEWFLMTSLLKSKLNQENKECSRPMCWKMMCLLKNKTLWFWLSCVSVSAQETILVIFLADFKISFRFWPSMCELGFNLNLKKEKQVEKECEREDKTICLLTCTRDSFETQWKEEWRTEAEEAIISEAKNKVCMQ